MISPDPRHSAHVGRGAFGAANLDAASFLHELHDALAHLRQLPFQASHPLATMLGTSTASRAPLTPQALRQALLDAIERLRPPPHVAPDALPWRRYRYLRLRYVEGAPLEQISTELGIGERQARREHRAALQELAAVLLERVTEKSPADSGSSPAQAASLGPLDATEPFRELNGDDLQIELTQVEAEQLPEPIDLRSAVEDAIRLVGRLASQRAVVVEHSLDAATPTVVATRIVLRQVLLNVLGYAISQESTERIRLSATTRGRVVDLQIVVIGRQARATRTADLGQLSTLPSPLLVARRLIEAQDGMLRVDDSSNSSTTVHLQVLGTQATLVLLVDDNPDLVRLFRRYLRGEGFRIVHARNAIRAHQMAHELRPDVIILDLMMPVQDGWDLLHALQEDPTTATIPIIACSVLPERELALSLGATDFLAKPVTPESLRAALEPRHARPDSTRAPTVLSDATEHPG